MLKQNWKTYAFWILLAEAVGGLSGWLTREGTKIYQSTVAQPPLSPPPLVFPIVWGILFALMGIGAAKIYLAPPSGRFRRYIRPHIPTQPLWTIIRQVTMTGSGSRKNIIPLEAPSRTDHAKTL